jgi:hypothetical protein
LGFVKGFALAPVEQLMQNISKPAGVLWLACAALFLLSAVLFLLKIDVWWMIGIAAVMLSQILIIISWSDAKAGTIANVIILAGAILAYGNWSFLKTAREEMRAFSPVFKSEKVEIITESHPAHIPPVVQKWLQRSGIIGKNLFQNAHIKQRGQMRTSPDGSWMPFTSEQHFTSEKPGFFWTADVGSAFMNFKGRDKYTDGHGHMLIKAYSLVPVVNSSGAEIDQGTLLRFMAESVWLPNVALHPYITWEQLDSTRAKATMTYAGTTASGIFTFTPDGDMQSFDAKRYYDRKTGATLEDWHVEAKAFKSFNGIRIPSQSAVTWRLKDGDFHWLDMEIMDVKYE